MIKKFKNFIKESPGLLVIIIFGAVVMKYGFNEGTEDYRVIDGDTIVLNGENVRLYGIDSPEIKQLCRDYADKEIECGKIAKEKLKEILRKMSQSLHLVILMLAVSGNILQYPTVMADDCQLTPVIHVLQYPGCIPKPIPSFACTGKCTSYVQVRRFVLLRHFVLLQRKRRNGNFFLKKWPQVGRRQSCKSGMVNLLITKKKGDGRVMRKKIES